MQADYVVVGAGSGGSPLAFRLAEAGRSVIVVEHGGTDAGPYIQMPGALSYPMNMPRYDWGYRTEPEPGLGGRRLVAPRGKVLGGSSSINGMVWVRGHPLDYAAWEAAGAAGWGWRHVAPYFRRIEDWDGPDDGGIRGRGGPMHVRRARPTDPLNRAFLAAGRRGGPPVHPRLQRRRAGGDLPPRRDDPPRRPLVRRQGLPAPRPPPRRPPRPRPRRPHPVRGAAGARASS